MCNICHTYTYIPYVIAISRYKRDIQVSAQDRGEAEVVGDDPDMCVKWEITELHPIQTDFHFVDLIGNN